MSSELSSEEIRTLAERAYPGLEPSGLCSRLHAETKAVGCSACYPDLWALIDSHLEQRRKLAVERDELRASLREVYDYMSEVEGAHMGCVAVRGYLSLPRTEAERKMLGERARELLGDKPR